MLEFVKRLLNPDVPSFINVSDEVELRNNVLEKQAEEHSQIENRLRKARYDLEKQVENLTNELSKCKEVIRHEISERRWDEHLLQDARVYTNSVIDMMQEPFVVLNTDMKVVRANRSFYRSFHLSWEEIENRVFYELNDGEWNIGGLRGMLEDILYGGVESQEVEIEHEFSAVGRKVMRINARRVHRNENSTNVLFLLIEDITERKELDHLHTKSRHETTISKVAQSVYGSINPQEVLDSAVSAVSENVNGADYVSVYLVEGKDAVMKSHRGLPDWFIKHSGRVSYPRGFIWKAVIEGNTIYRADVEKDSAFDPADRQLGTKSFVFLPLKFEDKTIGVISIKSRQVNIFGGEELKLLETIKQHVETALKNAQQAEALRKLDKHYAKTNGELELRVKGLTEELRKANERLIAETGGRKRMEDELKTLSEKLGQRDKELDDFAQVLSHGFKEPLRKIQGLSDRLEKKYGKELKDEGRKYLNQVRNAVKKIQTPVNDLEAFYRASTKAQRLIQINLTETTRKTLSDLEGLIERTGGFVEVGNLPNIDADPEQIHKLMYNLIGNALKFHKKGEAPVVKIRGQILNGQNGYRLGNSHADKVYQIVVEDNGVGFDEKDGEVIFNAFQRLHGRNKYGGTGMGLVICRKIVERHGGSITVKSAPEKGATFIVTLPAQLNGKGH